MSTTIENKKQGTGMCLAVVAGEGKLPGILARNAKAQGYRVVALALSEYAKAAVEPFADVTYVGAPGQIGRNMKLLKTESVDKLVFIGKVPKLSILQNIQKLDWTAVRELSKLPDFSDDTIQRAVGDLMETQGVKVVTQSEFLRELFPNYGIMTNRQPTTAEYADVEYGMRIAKEIARLDIGQTVVVHNQMIIAIEGIDGTDETIRRAVRLSKGSVVVCKAARPNQDQRFDIPAVGMTTLQSMIGDKPGGVLAVEAGQTLVVDQREMVEFAEKNGICMLSV